MRPQSSTASLRRRKKPKKTGIWNRIGRQPLAGFTPSSLNSAWISSFIFRCWSMRGRPLPSFSLGRYLARIASMRGFSFWIRCIETWLLWVSGNRTSRMTTVINTMLQPKFATTLS